MESKGNAALLKSGKTTEWRLHIGGYIAVAHALLILLGCVVAYLLTLMRGNVDAMLPLISDAAGSPPQNGLFGFLVSLGGMFGVALMLQRYLIVAEKNISKLSSVVVAVNKLSLVSGIVSLLGITLITGYPFNFQRNRDTWFMNVGLPHIVGGLLFFGLGLVYIALQTILTFLLKTKNGKILPARFLLLCICTGVFIFYIITVPEHLGSLSHLYYLNHTTTVLHPNATLLLPPTLGTDLQLPISTGGSYWSAAAAEWALVVAFCCFTLTFFKEAQSYAIVVQIETGPQEPESEFSRKMSVKPPEPKKVLRRDSTCQTNPEFFVSPTKKSHQQGPVTKEKMSEVDEKLQRILDASEEVGTEPPPNTNGVDKNGVTVEKNGGIVDRNGCAEKPVVQNGSDESQTKTNESNCPLSIQ